MNQTQELLTALKKCVRAKGLGYRDLAEVMRHPAVDRLELHQSPPVSAGGNLAVHDHGAVLRRQSIDQIRESAARILQLCRMAGLEISLQQRRAGEVAEFLKTALALPPEAISFEWAGDSRPIASNDTAEGRARNQKDRGYRP